MSEPTLRVSSSLYNGTVPDNPNPPIAATCGETGPFMFTDAQGRTHDLGLVHVEPDSTPASITLCPDQEHDAGVARDDNSIVSTLVWGSTSQAVTVTTGDGTRYYFSGQAGYQDPMTLTKVEDANGNEEFITVDSGGGQTWSEGGRVVASVAGPAGEPASVTLYNSDGGQRSFTLSWETKSYNFTMPNPNDGNCSPFADCTVDEAATGNLNDLAALTLPDGSTYQFGYDSTHGTVSQMTLPAGGVVGFDWTATPVYAKLSVAAGGGGLIPYSDLAVGEETTSAGNWTYAYNNGDTTTWNTKVTTITDPAGNTTTLTYAAQTDPSTVGGNASGRALLVRTVVANAGGAMLSTTTENYYQGTMKRHQVRTAMGDGTSAPPTREVDYAWGVGNDVTSETDYGLAACAIPAAPTASTYSQPLAGAGCLGPEQRQITRTFLASPSDLPLSEVVGNGGATLAQTNYAYDQTTPTASGAADLDTALATPRGNPTTVSRWVAGGSWLSSENVYDDAGNRIEATDPAGNHTYYSYADNWANTACLPTGGNSASYLTAVTDALGHVTHFQYNSCTGTLASKTDANGQAWTWAYDSLNRLAAAAAPDGGDTTYAYTPTIAPTTVETQVEQSTGIWMNTFETLGPYCQRSLKTDPQAIVEI